MATTIIPADAVVTLTVTLTLGGKTFDIEYSKTISSVTRADRNIVPMQAGSETDLIQLQVPGVSTSNDKGTFADFDGFFIMNRDDTNFVRIRISKAGADTVDFRLDPEEFMILWNSKMEVNTTEAAFGAYVDFEDVSIQADTATVDVEYLAFKI